MRTMRRRLMTSYANPDLPIRWQDEQVAAWATGKGLETRRDCIEVRSIASDDFRGNTELRRFPELRWFTRLAEISNGTFMNCSRLEDIALPDGIKVLYGQAFRGCTALKSLTLPSSIGRINGYVFSGCASIGWIRVLNPTPPTLDTDMPPFSATNSLLQFYVPDGSVEAYKAADAWKTYAGRIHPLSEWVE